MYTTFSASSNTGSYLFERQGNQVAPKGAIKIQQEDRSTVRKEYVPNQSPYSSHKANSTYFETINQLGVNHTQNLNQIRAKYNLEHIVSSDDIEEQRNRIKGTLTSLN